VVERTIKWPAVSFAAGLPGGLALAATIPADTIQYFGMALRLAQEIAYLYGEDDLWSEGNLKEEKVILIGKVLLSCLPAAVFGLLLDDVLDKYLYNGFVVSLMLILYGILFIFLERRNASRQFHYNKVEDLPWILCLEIGMFQCLALIPGTSRSGATIIGAMLLSVGRVAATEFSFFLSVPVMAGASLLKLIKHGGHFSGMEWFTLLLAMVLAYLVSLYCIRFLLRYIRSHDFTIFGYYRIIFGGIVLLWFTVSRFLM